MFPASKPPTVAFTALLSKVITIRPKATVKYDHVVTNWGGAYDQPTGIFSAPYDGLYSISFTLMGHPSNNVRLELVKNGRGISNVSTLKNFYLQSSETLHLILNKGDKIWMRNYSPTETAILHDWKVYNVFSGILIRDLWETNKAPIVECSSGQFILFFNIIGIVNSFKIFY